MLCAVSSKKLTKTKKKKKKKHTQLDYRFNCHLRKMLFALEKNYLIIYWIDSSVSLCLLEMAHQLSNQFYFPCAFVQKSNQIKENSLLLSVFFLFTPSTKVKMYVELGVASMLNNFLEERYHYAMWLWKKTNQRMLFKTAQ